MHLRIDAAHEALAAILRHLVLAAVVVASLPALLVQLLLYRIGRDAGTLIVDGRGQEAPGCGRQRRRRSGTGRSGGRRAGDRGGRRCQPLARLGGALPDDAALPIIDVAGLAGASAVLERLVDLVAAAGAARAVAGAEGGPVGADGEGQGRGQAAVVRVGGLDLRRERDGAAALARRHGTGGQGQDRGEDGGGETHRSGAPKARRTSAPASPSGHDRRVSGTCRSWAEMFLLCRGLSRRGRRARPGAASASP